MAWTGFVVNQNWDFTEVTIGAQITMRSRETICIEMVAEFTFLTFVDHVVGITHTYCIDRSFLVVLTNFSFAVAMVGISAAMVPDVGPHIVWRVWR